MGEHIKRANEDIATAHHEAGHAVFAWLYGIDLETITITPEVDTSGMFEEAYGELCSDRTIAGGGLSYRRSTIWTSTPPPSRSDPRASRRSGRLLQ